MVIISSSNKREARSNRAVVESIVSSLFGNDELCGEVARQLMSGRQPTLEEMRSRFQSEFRVSRIGLFKSLVHDTRSRMLSFLNDDKIGQLAAEARIDPEEVRETCRPLLR
jgi:hypothetical protein